VGTLRPEAGLRRRRGAWLFATGLGLVAAGAGLTARGAAAEAPESAPLRARLADEPDARIRQLLAERVLVLAPDAASDGSGPRVEAYVLFDRPIRRVYELLSATGRQPEFRTDLARQLTVSRDADGVVEEQHLRVLFVEVVYRLRYRLDPPARRIEWHLDPSFDNDLRRLDGFWELHELDASHTLARFGTAIDVGEAMPAFVEESMTRHATARTLARCREWVNADGAAR